MLLIQHVLPNNVAAQRWKKTEFDYMTKLCTDVARKNGLSEAGANVLASAMQGTIFLSVILPGEAFHRESWPTYRFAPHSIADMVGRRMWKNCTLNVRGRVCSCTPEEETIPRRNVYCRSGRAKLHRATATLSVGSPVIWTVRHFRTDTELFS